MWCNNKVENNSLKEEISDNYICIRIHKAISTFFFNICNN
ncbi:protein of unknown function [Clostridium beijerinckii]|nr:protein of unknown function [Clostridium beijerinckii]